MRSKESRIECDGADPLPDQAGILAGGHRAVGLAAAGKHEFARPATALLQIGIDRLARWLSQLEPDGPARFLWRTVARSKACPWGATSSTFKATAAELAVDREIERREVAHTVLELQFAPN
jgi:hypothetical protein